MTALAPTRRPTGKPSALLVAGLALGSVAPVLVLAVLGAMRPTPSSPAPDVFTGQRQRVLAYEASVQPLLEDAGRVVALGLRPGVTDISEGAFADDVLVTMARGWVAQLVEVRRALAEIPVPAEIRREAALLRRSLDQYVAAGEKLLAGAKTRGDQRAVLVDEAAVLGERADATYDRARSEIDAVRRRFGLSTSAESGAMAKSHIRPVPSKLHAADRAEAAATAVRRGLV